MPYDPSTDSACTNIWDAANAVDDGSGGVAHITDSKGSSNLVPQSVSGASAMTHITMPAGRWSTVSSVQIDWQNPNGLGTSGMSINSQSFSLAGVIEISDLVTSNPGVVVGLDTGNSIAWYIQNALTDYFLKTGFGAGSTSVICPCTVDIVITGSSSGAKVFIEGTEYDYGAFTSATWSGFQIGSWTNQYGLTGGGIIGSWLLYNTALDSTGVSNARSWTRTKANLTATPAQAFIILGDSIAAGKGPVSQQAYAHICSIPADTRVYNFAVSGQLLSTIISNESSYVSTINAIISALSLTNVGILIAAGTNDINGGTGGSSLFSSYKSFGEYLSAHVTGATVSIISIPIIDRSQGTTPETERGNFNTALAADNSWSVYANITNTNLMSNGAASNTTYFVDGIHPTYAGAALMLSSGLQTAITTVFVPPPPATPTGFTGSDVVTVSLSWTASTGATSYKVFRGGVQIGTPTATSYTDTLAVASGSYSYTVEASNSGGDSAPTSAVVMSTGGGSSVVVVRRPVQIPPRAFIASRRTTIVTGAAAQAPPIIVPARRITVSRPAYQMVRRPVIQTASVSNSVVISPRRINFSSPRPHLTRRVSVIPPAPIQSTIVLSPRRRIDVRPRPHLIRRANVIVSGGAIGSPVIVMPARRQTYVRHVVQPVRRPVFSISQPAAQLVITPARRMFFATRVHQPARRVAVFPVTLNQTVLVARRQPVL